MCLTFHQKVKMVNESYKLYDLPAFHQLLGVYWPILLGQPVGPKECLALQQLVYFSLVPSKIKHFIWSLCFHFNLFYLLQVKNLVVLNVGKHLLNITSDLWMFPQKCLVESIGQGFLVVVERREPLAHLETKGQGHQNKQRRHCLKKSLKSWLEYWKITTYLLTPLLSRDWGEKAGVLIGGDKEKYWRAFIPYGWKSKSTQYAGDSFIWMFWNYTYNDLFAQLL